MKNLIALLLIVALLPGCAAFQLHRPLNGGILPNIYDPNLLSAATDGVLVLYPELTREQAQALAKQKFLDNRSEVMTEYGRVDAALSLAARLATLFGKK